MILTDEEIEDTYRKTSDCNNEFARAIEAAILKKIAASQAREQQLREALAWASDNLTRGATSEFEADDECTCPACKALYIPTDDTALREMIAKAGEVMRERCVQEWIVALQTPGVTVDEAIRALPGVTMEDIQ
jgi:hypothetical protein